MYAIKRKPRFFSAEKLIQDALFSISYNINGCEHYIMAPIKNTSPVIAGQSPQDKVLLSSKFTSPEFLAKLEEAAIEIKCGAKLSATEATIAGRFERILYATLKDIGISFHPEKEEAIDTLRHVGRNGRLDSRIGAIVIEYKRPAAFQTTSQVSKAKAQLKNYLKALSEYDKCAVYGLITDGNRCVEIKSNLGVIESDTDPLPLNAQALLRLARGLTSLDSTALTAKNLIRDFCGDNHSGILFQVARTFYDELAAGSSPKTLMLHSEWKALFAIGHNDLSQQKRIQERREILSKLLERKLKTPEEEYRGLFAVHTAYAIIIKLIAFRVVCDLWERQASRFGKLLSADSKQLQIFCHGLEEGEVFRQIGILNLLEGDFFSWYSDKSQWSTAVGTSVKKVLEVLSRYEQAIELFRSTGAMDIFKELYEATVPQVVRGSFGEFYTPQWLASHVLNTALGQNNKGRVLDPCCGSGTFLITAIERIRREAGQKTPAVLLQEIFNSVSGIDLNPLAVLMARVNYFIHIVDLLPTEITNLVVPIYLGDASYVPQNIVIEGIPCIEYTLNTIKDPIDVILPTALIQNTPAFVEAMLEYEKLIVLKDPIAASNSLIKRIPEGHKTEAIRSKVGQLSEQLVNLEKKGWNGIWARILTNFLTTAALGRFDVIVGNPPWIDWKNLPTTYREKIKTLCIDRGLFSGDGRTGGINLNVCGLICHVAIANWLKPKGRLAFLMPRELVLQQSYEGWRNLSGTPRRYFEEFHDWSAAGHPFDPVKEDFMTFVIGSTPPEEDFVPVTLYQKKRSVKKQARDWVTLEEANSSLESRKALAGQIIPGKTIFTIADTKEELKEFGLVAGNCEYIGREGIEFFPQELVIFKPKRPGPKKGVWWFQNIQVQKSKYRIPQHEVLLETEFMFPLVKGAALERFKHDYEDLVVPLPYKDTNSQQPIQFTELRKIAPFLSAFYKKFEQPLREQTGFSDKIRGPNPGEFYGLARTGPYSFKSVYVGFRDNTKWRACVVTPKTTAWGGMKRFVFQNHAVSICERTDRSYVSLNEAHYICAILNAPIVEKFIYASSDQRSYKIRPPISLPKYNPELESHCQLSELSKKAHKVAGSKAELALVLAEIEQVYMKICRCRR